MCGKENIGLIGQGLADLVGPVADDNDDGARAGASDGLDDVVDHRLAADLVEHFRPLRFHPLAMSGRQDDRYRSLHRAPSPFEPSRPDVRVQPP